jgi:hypothetical protein
MTGGVSRGDRPFLLTHHTELLSASAIHCEVAAERGYQTVYTVAELGLREGRWDRQNGRPSGLGKAGVR